MATASKWVFPLFPGDECLVDLKEFIEADGKRLCQPILERDASCFGTKTLPNSKAQFYPAGPL